MILRTYPKPIRKRPRRFHKFVPILSSPRCGECPDCLAYFQAQVDRERPGHLWRVENGHIHYQEDDVMEKHLSRKLTASETVIFKNDDPQDCRIENLEIVEIPDMGPA